MDHSNPNFSLEPSQALGSDDGSLDAHAVDLGALGGTTNAECVCGTQTASPPAPEDQNRAASEQHRAAPMFSTFPASTEQGPRRKRAKFEDPKARAKVAQVRKDGACMRCRMNKIPCSSTRPCMSCISSWVSLDARSSKLRWMSCVPFSWNNVNIYRLESSQTHFEPVLRDISVLTEEQTALHFDELVKWDIDALSTDFATWIATDDVQPAPTSRVGILSSMDCQRLLSHYLDDDLCTSLRLLVKTSSLLYGREGSPHPHYGREQLICIRDWFGVRILKILEAALKSTALARASKDKLKGLFLVLLGVIIAVTYTVTTDHEEARRELLRILAHHMIFVRERIGLLDCDLTKQRLVESCHNMWNKIGNFEWKYEVSSAVEGMDGGASVEQGQSFLWFPSAVSVLTSPRPFVPEENDRQPDDILNVESPHDVLHQVDLIQDAGPQSATGIWPASGSLEGIGTKNIDGRIAVGMTTCFLCNTIFRADEMCPACFGHLPFTTSCSDVALQGDFDSTLPVPESQSLRSVDTPTEATLVNMDKALLQSDPSVSSTLSRAESSNQSLLVSKYAYGPKTSKGNANSRPVECDSDRDDIMFKGTLRKLHEQRKKTTKKTGTTVRRPRRNDLEHPRQSRNEPSSASRIYGGTNGGGGRIEWGNRPECFHCRIVERSNRSAVHMFGWSRSAISRGSDFQEQFLNASTSSNVYAPLLHRHFERGVDRVICRR